MWFPKHGRISNCSRSNEHVVTPWAEMRIIVYMAGHKNVARSYEHEKVNVGHKKTQEAAPSGTCMVRYVCM